MTWDEVLQAFQALLGREVMVSVSAEGAAQIVPGFRPMGVMMAKGTLRHGRPNEVFGQLQTAGLADAGEEVLSFHIGNAETDVQITLTRSRVAEAGRVDLPNVVAFYVAQDGVLLSVSDVEGAMTAFAGDE